MKQLLIALLLMVRIGHAADEPKPETIKHRITGLFEPERAEHLRELFKAHPKVKLLAQACLAEMIHQPTTTHL